MVKLAEEDNHEKVIEDAEEKRQELLDKIEAQRA